MIQNLNFIRQDKYAWGVVKKQIYHIHPLFDPDGTTGSSPNDITVL